MSLSRHVLLALSTSQWLRTRAEKSNVVRRSVRRFMPGERMEDALAAATDLQSNGYAAILTHLGENITTAPDAMAVVHHYLEVLDRVHAQGLDAQVSVKPTQLGLDFDPELCRRLLQRLAERAGSHGRLLWVDMESSPYVERTIDLVRNVSGPTRVIGLALQAYLYRTAADLESLLPVLGAVRVVKGAYLEPASVAYPKKADVDENYFRLATRALDAATAGGPQVHLATHDAVLVERLTSFIDERRILASSYEYAMLYGIGRPLQRQLSLAGRRVRVLISYGEHWFPWYMRRLAERPANLWFVLKNLAN